MAAAPCWRRCLLAAACLAAAARAEPAAQAPVAAPAAAADPTPDPDAEGVVDGGDTDARFLFKVNRRRYNRRYPGYNGNGYDYGYSGYDSSWQCGTCGYGAVDYTTARRCCRQGYSSCCFESGGGDYKPGSCPYQPYGSTGSDSTYYCRSECTRDSDCYGSQKCCGRGCSRTCQYPSGGSGSGYQKPGSCPYYGSQGGGFPSYPYYPGGSSTLGGSYCRRDCNQDSECPGSQKCCDVNCSSTCVTPQRYY